MCIILLHLAVESCDLSQAEQIHKSTTTVNWRDCFNLVLCYAALFFEQNIIRWGKTYEQNLMIRYALCYALLCCLMISI
jgi:hypothetical protein